MTILLFIVPVLLVATVVFVVIRKLKRLSGSSAGDTGKRIPFRWQYILLPLIFTLLTLLMAVIFYGKLPDQTAYRFLTGGLPAVWTSRAIVVGVVLVIQLLLTLAGWGIVIAAGRAIKIPQSEEAFIKPENLLNWMGNMMALPQFIVSFVLLDIFSYNVYQVHFMPVWLFVVLVLVIASIGFLGFLVYLVVKAVKQNTSK